MGNPVAQLSLWLKGFWLIPVVQLSLLLKGFRGKSSGTVEPLVKMLLGEPSGTVYPFVRRPPWEIQWCSSPFCPKAFGGKTQWCSLSSCPKALGGKVQWCSLPSCSKALGATPVSNTTEKQLWPCTSTRILATPVVAHGLVTYVLNSAAA